MITQKQIIYFILVATAIAALFLYNPWLLYFQNDDMVHIPLSRDGIIFQHHSFRPICDISMIADYRLWQKNAWGYHLTNLILHLINTVLVFFLSKKILKKYSAFNDINIIAFTTAILFWIYMNHSEAVFWILGRSAMLGMIFFLPACIFYLKRERNLYFILSILFSFLAWISYESTIILPVLFLIILFIDIQKKFSSLKKEIPKFSIVIISFIIYLVVRFYFTGTLSTEYEQGSLSNGISVLIGNFLKLIMRSWLPPFQNSTILVSLVVFLFVLIGFVTKKILHRKQQQFIVILFLFFLISLLPYTTLSVDTKGLESERFLYLPSFFVCLIIAIIVFQFKFYSQIILVVIICLLNISLLSFHAKQYRFAGSIVKTTIDAVNNLHNKQILFCDNVPQENFGALIFRKGLPEGINWLKNEKTVDSVVEISQSQTDLPLQKIYRIKYSNDLSLIPNVTITKQFGFNDAYFLYTDSTLFVITIK